MNEECDFHNGNRREQIVTLLAEAQRLILAPADADEKCKDLIERACELMRLIEVQK